MRSDEIRKEALSVYSHANVRDRYDADLMMAGFSDGAEWADAHPVAPEPQGEPSDAQRHAQARVQARIHEDHAPHFHLGQCKCGASLGDTIDWNWHLTGVTLRAAGRVR